METYNKQEFIDKSVEALSRIFDDITQLESISLSIFDKAQTALIIVDMVNGFVKEGPLSSPRIPGILPAIKELLFHFNQYEMPVIAFADTHPKDSPEFATYLPHCLENTSESEIVDELKGKDKYLLIRKNSTNGFHEKEFQEVLVTNPQLNTFVVTGCCTDICVLQFCLTLKTFFNMNNRVCRIIVPLDSVETFEFGSHDGGLMNILPLKLMQNAGIEIVKGIE